MDSSLINALLTGGGGGVVVLAVIVVLFVTGKIFSKGVVDDLKAENAELKAAVAAERAKADTAVAGNSSMRDVFEAIRLGRDLGSQGSGGAVHGHEHPPLPGAAS